MRSLQQPSGLSTSKSGLSTSKSVAPGTAATSALGKSTKPRPMLPAPPLPSAGATQEPAVGSSTELNYDKVVAIFSAPHPPALADKRVTAAVERVARVNSAGAAIRDLPQIERLLLLVYAYSRKNGTSALDEPLRAVLRQAEVNPPGGAPTARRAGAVLRGARLTLRGCAALPAGRSGCRSSANPRRTRSSPSPSSPRCSTPWVRCSSTARPAQCRRALQPASPSKK